MKFRSAPAPAAPAASVLSSAQPFTLLDKLFPFVFPVLLFAAVTIQTPGMAFVLAALALVSFVGRAPFAALRSRVTVASVGFLLFLLAQLAAALYASDGADAANGLVKIVASGSVGVLVLTRLHRDNVRRLLWGLCAVCAVVALLCVSVGVGGSLFQAFNSLMHVFGASYDNLLDAGLSAANNSRFNGIYRDGNVSAALLSLSALLSLHLALTEEKKPLRALAVLLAGVNAMSFFLSLSRGALLCMVPAVLVYLLVVGPDRRLSLFFLGVCTLLPTVALSALSMKFLQEGSPVPTLLTLACGVLAAVLDLLLGSRLTAALAGHGRAFALSLAALAVVCVGYAVAAVNVTGSLTLAGNNRVLRAVDLPAGTYTVSVDMTYTEREPQLTFLTQTYQQSAENTATVLYRGGVEGASFTLEQDAHVLVQLDALDEYDVVFRAVTVTDGAQTYAVKLGYPLLPSFVANRLQDNLLQSYSLQQRFRYDADGWKLFTLRPLTGYGLGGSTPWIYSVQPYYYESLFLHNHILQVAVDNGVIGLAPFLMLLLGALALCLRGRRQGDPLAAALLACWTMMNLHSLMEISFSIRAYQCVAWVLLLLPAVLYAKPLERHAVAAGRVTAALAFAVLAAVTAVDGLHYRAQSYWADYSPSDAYAYMDTLGSLIRQDRLDHQTYQLNYIAQWVGMDRPSRYSANANRYIRELRAKGTYYGCTSLAVYQYLPAGDLDEAFAASRQGIAQLASNPQVWDQEVEAYRTVYLSSIQPEQAEDFVSGVLALQSLLEDYRANVWQDYDVTLSDANAAFLTSVSQLAQQDLSGAALYTALTVLAQSAGAQG